MSRPGTGRIPLKERQRRTNGSKLGAVKLCEHNSGPVTGADAAPASCSAEYRGDIKLTQVRKDDAQPSGTGSGSAAQDPAGSAAQELVAEPTTLTNRCNRKGYSDGSAAQEDDWEKSSFGFDTPPKFAHPQPGDDNVGSKLEKEGQNRQGQRRHHQQLQQHKRLQQRELQRQKAILGSKPSGEGSPATIFAPLQRSIRGLLDAEPSPVAIEGSAGDTPSLEPSLFDKGVGLFNKVGIAAVEAATKLDGHFENLMDGRGWATPSTTERSRPSAAAHTRRNSRQQCNAGDNLGSSFRSSHNKTAAVSAAISEAEDRSAAGDGNITDESSRAFAPEAWGNGLSKMLADARAVISDASLASSFADTALAEFASSEPAQYSSGGGTTHDAMSAIDRTSSSQHPQLDTSAIGSSARDSSAELAASPEGTPSPLKTRHPPGSNTTPGWQGSPLEGTEWECIFEADEGGKYSALTHPPSSSSEDSCLVRPSTPKQHSSPRTTATTTANMVPTIRGSSHCGRPLDRSRCDKRDSLGNKAMMPPPLLLQCGSAGFPHISTPDGQVQCQLEALLGEKVVLARENARLARENAGLLELLSLTRGGARQAHRASSCASDDGSDWWAPEEDGIGEVKDSGCNVGAMERMVRDDGKLRGFQQSVARDSSDVNIQEPRDSASEAQDEALLRDSQHTDLNEFPVSSNAVPRGSVRVDGESVDACLQDAQHQCSHDPHVGDDAKYAEDLSNSRLTAINGQQ